MNTVRRALFRVAHGGAVELRVWSKERKLPIGLPVTEVNRNSSWNVHSRGRAAGIATSSPLHFLIPLVNFPPYFRMQAFDPALMLLPCRWILAED